MKQYVIYYVTAYCLASIAQAQWKPAPQLDSSIKDLGARLEYACSHLDQVTDSESQALSDALSKASSHDIQLDEYCEL
jgi:hypothetical protein